MDESTLRTYDKATLKTMALSKGLLSAGFNGRNISRMRKKDFIDFIIFRSGHEDHESDDSSSTTDGMTLEDEMYAMLNDLVITEFNPIIQIMGALNSLERSSIYFRNNIALSEPSTSVSNPNGRKEPPQERIPNEEDENVPDLTFKDLLAGENSCTADCTCAICVQNNDIEKENLKVKTNLYDVETKITCVICHSHMRNVIFNPCNHLATCITCSKNPSLDKCPLCRTVFEGTTRVFS
jgi:hypothetical protein